jgi:tRNA-dihydrouridine synthase
MKNFWQKLNKPFFCLAPMYDVTDAAFRAMFVKYSKGVRNATSSEPEVVFRTPAPLVLFTEFVSADGLASDEGRPKLLRELYYTEAERPIVAQIFGSKPENIEKAVRLIKELGFDGVDINMGCPDRAIEKQGAGSALIKNSKLAEEIIEAAKRGASDSKGRQIIPVSLKTRLGYNKIDFDWIKAVFEAKPDAVTFHLRTRKEMSEAKAHYEIISEIVKIFESSNIPLIINGDIESVKQGKELAKKYNIDGVMIGRGAFGKPWFFQLGRAKSDLAPTSQSFEGHGTRDTTSHRLAGEDVRNATSSEPEVVFRTSPPDLKIKLQIMLEHSRLFWDLFDSTQKNKELFNGHTKNFAVMRKHFKAYVSGFKGATALRVKLMQANNPDEVKAIIDDFSKIAI